MLLFAVGACVGAVAHAQSIDLNSYYANAIGKKKGDLKTAMRDIANHGDVTTLKYGSGYNKTWYGFYFTDRMSDNEVRDRYSNEHHYFSGSNYAAVSGMNIEHSFPKSWWGGSENQAYKDLHHLMPCESNINSSKSNYGMGKVVVASIANNDCTKVGKGPGAGGNTINLWEPANKWKGDFARAVFYMVTCYQDLTWTGEALNSLTNTEWPTLQPWAYELYLQWAENDPVDEIERARNEAVYKIQNNRNPFIDLPDLAQYIWGSKMDEEFTIDGTVPGPGPTPEPGDSILIAYQMFKGSDGSLGDFTTVKPDGTQSTVWKRDTNYGMVANAYSLGKTGDDYLISPALDLTGMQGATLEFRHAAGYHNGANPSEMFEVLVSTDYVQEPEYATWTRIEDVEWPIEVTSGKFTKFIHSGRLCLDDYVGETVNVAFHYTATSTKCWAWEIESFTVRGKPLPTGIDDNYMSPIDAEDAVFDMNGRYIGTEVPTRRGIYIVRQGGYTYKRFVK